MSTSVQWLPTG